MSRAARWIGDGLAVLLLAGVFIYWSAHDGGRDTWPVLYVAGLALLTAPALVSPARRLGPLGMSLLGLWGIGALVSFAFALERSQFAEPMLILGLVPLVFLATLRLWDRRWGPAVVLAILLIAFGRYWQRSYMQWWGHSLRENPSAEWLALSWRNQSGTLMGAFAVSFIGAGLVQRRLVSAGLLLAGAGGLAGVWLSGSRGALVVTVAGLMIAAVAAVQAQRSHESGSRLLSVVRSVGLRLSGAVASAVGTVLVLASMMPSGGQPLAARTQSATGNLLARLDHMLAAFRMFLDRPLTGQGIGSYPVMARGFTPPDANLTASAHNEYLEMLAEGGLLFGVAFIGVGVVATALVLRSLRARSRPMDSAEIDLSGAMGVGAAGALALLAAHFAVDLDWFYPVLPALSAVGLAVLVSRRLGSEGAGGGRLAAIPGGRWLAAGTVVAVAALAAFGGAGILAASQANVQAGGLSPTEYARYPEAWNHQRALGHALNLLERGHSEAASLAVSRTERWNPGVENVALVEAMIAYETGEITSGQLTDALPPDTRQFSMTTRIAEQLARHDKTDLAVRTIDQMLERIGSFANWGISQTVSEAALVKTKILADAERCEDVRAWLRDALGLDPIVSSSSSFRTDLRKQLVTAAYGCTSPTDPGG